jgi:hypothetical protein
MTKKNIVTLVIILFLFACGKKDEFPSVNYTDDQQKATLKVEGHEGAVDIKLNSINIVNPTDSVFAARLNSEIDSFLLSKYYINGTFKSFDELKDTLYQEYKDLVTEFPDVPYGYSLEREVKVETDTLGIFSISKFEMTFLGGAHPNSTLFYSNYSTTNNSVITLEELIIDNGIEKLTQIAEQIFRKEKQLVSDADLNEAGYWFENGQFRLNDNFLIQKEGLLFYYNNYEITAYAVGPTELFIPYNDFNNLIKEDSPLRVFLH